VNTLHKGDDDGDDDDDDDNNNNNKECCVIEYNGRYSNDFQIAAAFPS
jgi:hypothetical protein